MLVAVDVDDTVADLLTAWLRRYNNDFHDWLRPEDITEWDITKFVKTDCGVSIYKYLEDPDIYNDVTPIEGAIQGVKLLRAAGHRVIFVTAGGEASKFEWLLKYEFLDNRKDYVRCVDKSLIRADVLIDDGPHNLKDFIGERIMMLRPHNARERAEGKYWIACGWYEIPDMINDIMETA
jgi:5'-nucleotidase